MSCIHVQLCYLYSMKNELTVKNESGEVVANVGIDAVRFERISDRLDYNWALWEVNVALPSGDCVTGFMQACPFAPEASHDSMIELD